MKHNKRNLALPLVLVLLALLGAAGEKTFLGSCVHEDGSFGLCHYAGEALFGLWLVMGVQALAAVFFREAGVRRGIFLCLFLEALLGLMLPGRLIPLCSMASMRCQSVMRPGMLVLDVLTGLLALLGFFLDRKAEPGRERGGRA